MEHLHDWYEPRLAALAIALLLASGVLAEVAKLLLVATTDLAGAPVVYADGEGPRIPRARPLSPPSTTNSPAGGHPNVHGRSHRTNVTPGGSPPTMPDFTDACLTCGVEYVPIATEPGECPDCGSAATPLVGTPTVLDVRAKASIAAAGADDPHDTPDLEVRVSDDTDRVIAFAVETADGGRAARIAGAAFEDDVVIRTHDHWDEDVVPECVYETATDYLADVVRRRGRSAAGG